jgi:hypothetical protein
MSGHAGTITRTRWISVLIAINEPGRIMQIVAAAGGSLVDGGARDWIVLAESGERGFAARLVAAGALLVLDGRLGKSCFDLGN